MLIKLSRYLLIFLVILLASVYIPSVYNLIFHTPERPPRIQYSPILKDILIIDFENDRFIDSKGKEYSRDELDDLLPLTHYGILFRKGILPDSINGIKLEIERIRKSSANFRIRPQDYEKYLIPLYPLFNSQPEEFSFEMKSLMFRLTDKIEVINVETNQIDTKYTMNLNNALINTGFEFPAKHCYGNPNIRKAFDEGYFILDSKNQLFNIKMIDNELICVKIIYPAELTIKSIFVREQSLQEFSGLVVTEENKLYLIKSDNNEFLEMPVNEYNPDTDRLRFQANLLYRFFFIYQDNQQILYVLDSDYRYINKYRYKMDNSDLSFSKQVIQYIFPFEVRMTSENSVYINFYFSNLNISSIYLNILLVLILIFWDWKNTNRINKRWSDYLLVLFTGIYGLIAIKIIE